MSNLKIAFIHPNLGIGGAEQLMVNLAVALQNKGHFVKFYTPYHDPTHCFKQTIDGTLQVKVCGNLIPASIRGRAVALCAYLRMIIATLYLIFYGGWYDLVIVDQVSACLPFLRLTGRTSLFYCHFPDKLLCVDRQSLLKRIYRFFLDWIEDFTMLFANMVLVNSNFTKDIVLRSFFLYRKFGKIPQVLYPSVDFSQFDELGPLCVTKQDSRLQKNSYFLSLNRFERKKNIKLAIEAFSLFINQLKDKKEDESIEHVKLIVTGGFDKMVRENREYFDELNDYAHNLGVSEQVSFKKNATDEERTWLLKNAICVLYTPENEHFGIVPIEAMYNETPVIACNSGGPKETIVDGKTGFLCNPSGQEWCQKMVQLFKDEKLAEKIGMEGHQQIVERFSFQKFSNDLNEMVLNLRKKKSKVN